MFKNKLFLSVSIFSLIFSFVLINKTEAATKCTFTRDLELGTEGEDVRCLQKFLNEAGFTVSTSGVGSPGKETTQLKDLTKKAVEAWQKTQGITPTGIFGPVSRAKYSEAASVVLATPSSSPAPIACPSGMVCTLNKPKTTTPSSSPSPTPSPVVETPAVSSSEKTAREAIKKALSEISDAEDQIDEGNGDATKAKKELDNARDDMNDAVFAYFDGKYSDALEAAQKSFDNAEDAFLAAGGKSQKDETDDRISDIEDLIDQVWDKIDVANKDKKDTDKAESLLNQAEDKIKDATKKFKAKSYDDAENLADDAEDLADDALRAIGNSSDQKNDARDAIRTAQTAIDKADDAIKDAQDDDEDTDDAEDYYDDAQNKLDDAQSEYDDKDYDRAIDLAKDAKKLADKAKNAL